MDIWKRAGKQLKEDLFNLRFALAGIAVYFTVVHFAFGQFCPMLIFLQFPCPGCGMTRALFFVLTGRWAAAWHLQPLIFGWIAWGLWFAVERYFLAEDFRLGLSAGHRSSVRKSRWFLRSFLILLLVGTLALYVWRLVHGFPGELA